MALRKMADPICTETGTQMKRGVVPMTISYKDQSATFDMPGWYCDECGESVHTGEDIKGSDRMLNRLKAQQKNQHTVKSSTTAEPTMSSR